jgi:type IV pilus assembly protein PilM
MAAKYTKVLAIDIGSDSLKIAEFDYPAGGGIVLNDFAFRKFGEDDEQGIAFYQLYHEILKEKKFTAVQVALTISGQASFSRLSKLPPLLGNKGAIQRIVEYEARQTVPYAMNEVVWDYQLISHTWEEKHEEEQEDGTVIEVADPQEEFEALFVAIKNDLVTRYTDIIEDSGKEILSVEIAPVALYNAAKGGLQCGEEECVLLLNIGGKGSNLMIADHNRVFMRSIPIAGDAITNQIAKEYGISFSEAEELKMRHGFVALGGAYEEPESVVAATISKIARNVMTRLHGEVSRSINAWRAQHGGNAPTRVLLAGGGSVMTYITDFFQEKLRIPVEYLNTFGLITFSSRVDKNELQGVAPMFQELIGMSLHQMGERPIAISLIPRSILKQRELDSKKPYFYLAAAFLVVCLSVFSFGLNRRFVFDKAQVDKVQASVDATNRQAAVIRQLNDQFNAAKGRYEEMNNILKERTKWIEVMMKLQALLPDTVWLTAVEGVGPIAAPQSANAAGGFGGEPDPAGGFGGFGGFDGGDAAPANVVKVVKKKFVPIDSINMTEITGVRLIGYWLKVGSLQAPLQQLIDNVGKSDFFELPGGDQEWKLVDNQTSHEYSNLGSFELTIKLKTPIKK